MDLIIQVENLYYKMYFEHPSRGQAGALLGPPAPQDKPLARPSGRASKLGRAVGVEGGAVGTAKGPGWNYLIPVVAMPLIRNRWPKRNTRNTGRRDTMDIANSDPQLVADCESTKARRATGTVNMSGSVR